MNSKYWINEDNLRDVNGEYYLWCPEEKKWKKAILEKVPFDDIVEEAKQERPWYKDLYQSEIT